MQIYSKKKVKEIVVQNLAQQGGENEEKAILKQLDKIYNHYNKKNPIYLIMIEASAQWVAGGRGLELSKALHKYGVQYIIIPCVGRREDNITIAEIKGE